MRFSIIAATSMFRSARFPTSRGMACWTAGALSCVDKLKHRGRAMDAWNERHSPSRNMPRRTFLSAAVASTAAAIAGSVLAAESDRSNSEQGDHDAMLSWQVGRVKITRIVEMDLPVPAEYMQGATPE